MNTIKRGTTFNPEWAVALEKAIPFLWDGVTKDSRAASICFALVDSKSLHARELYEEISCRLLSVNDEFVYFSDFYRTLVNPEASQVEVQDARKAWMLDMIEEFRDERNKLTDLTSV